MEVNINCLQNSQHINIMTIFVLAIMKWPAALEVNQESTRKLDSSERYLPRAQTAHAQF